MSDDVNIMDMQYECLVALQERELEAMLEGMTWLGNPFGIPRDSAINPIPDLLNSGIFIGILFFRS
jgi:hypothetical protein